jgi:hypothetical protein
MREEFLRRCGRALAPEKGVIHRTRSGSRVGIAAATELPNEPKAWWLGLPGLRSSHDISVACLVSLEPQPQRCEVQRQEEERNLSAAGSRRQPPGHWSVSWAVRRFGLGRMAFPWAVRGFWGSQCPSRSRPALLRRRPLTAAARRARPGRSL